MNRAAVGDVVSLQAKVENNQAVVGVIGLGYVGLPLMAA